MKKYRNMEQGSVIIVAAIGIAVLITGALGWTLYQNATGNDDVKNKVETTTPAQNGTKPESDKVTKEEPKETNKATSNPKPRATKPAPASDRVEAYVELTKWGVKMPVGINPFGFRVKLENGVYMVYSSTVARECGNDGNVGMIVQGSQSNAHATVKVGGKNYSFNTPQNACADPSTAKGRQTNGYQSDVVDGAKGCFELLRTI